MDTCTTQQEAIAIVGIACEFPSGRHSDRNLDANAYWSFLREGKTAYEDIPNARFNASEWHGKGPGKVITSTACIMKHAEMFDAVQFHVSPADARAMTVSTRKLIELSHVALQDAGIEHRARPVGVYAAGVTYDILANSDHDEFDAAGSVAGYPNAIANRISLALDLHGPSIPIDNACSSTLTALHLAVQGLRSGDCESALVAGCQFNSRIEEFIQLTQAQVLSPDGMCKPFDADADGFGKSDGAAVVCLKPLSAAIRDGDHVYAQILGSALTTNGAAVTVNAPSAAHQKAAIERAYLQAGRDPAECDYAELHATGTAVGDPIEANAVGEMLGRNRMGRPLVLGSVKGNMGHLENTAFLASLLKCIYMLRDRVIPPQANLKRLNPRIDWRRHNMRLAVPNEQLEGGEQPLISLSSFGIGGTNGHVVVQGHAQGFQEESEALAAARDEIMEEPVLLILGALSPKAFHKIIAGLKEQLSEASAASTRDMLPWKDVSSLTTRLARQARQCTWRASKVVQLADLCSGDWKVSMPEPVLVPRIPAPLVLVFSGQGPQHWRMGYDLFRRFRQFRETAFELDEVHRSMTGISLIHDVGLFDSRQSAKAEQLAALEWPARLIFPSLTLFQCALFDTLVAILGRQPDVVVGHSAGEAAVLYASGSATRHLAMQVAVLRGRHMSAAETLGAGMLALACDERTALGLVEAVSGSPKGQSESVGLSVAAYNSATAVALSGPRVALELVAQEAARRSIRTNVLRTKVPSHSSWMEICKDEFLAEARALFANEAACFRRPQIKTFSSVTASPMLDSFSVEYLWQNIRQPVQFHQAISAIGRMHPGATFFEVSAHPVLLPYIAESAAGSATLASARRPDKQGRSLEVKTFMDSIGRLCTQGHGSLRTEHLTWGISATRGRDVFPTLPYPFERQAFPIYAEHASQRRKLFQSQGPLCHPRLRMSRTTHPLLAEHVVQGEPIVPAAAFLEMALEFGANTLYRCSFASMLSIPRDRPATIEVSLDGARWAVRTQRPALGHRLDAGSEWDALQGGPFNVVHAQGFLSRAPHTSSGGAMVEKVDLQALRSTLDVGDIKALYERGWNHTMSYGPRFRRIQELWVGNDDVLAVIGGAEDEEVMQDGYVTSPAVVDCALHPLLHFVVGKNGLASPPSAYYLPSSVERVLLHPAYSEGQRDMRSDVASWSHLVSWRLDHFIADLCILALDGTPLITFEGLKLARHSAVSGSPEHAHEMVWMPLASAPKRTNTERKEEIVFRLPTSTRGLSEEEAAMLDNKARSVGRRILGRRTPDELFKLGVRASVLLEATHTATLTPTLGITQTLEANLSSRYYVHADALELLEHFVDSHEDGERSFQTYLSHPVIRRHLAAEAEEASVEDVQRCLEDLLDQFEAAGRRSIRILEIGCNNGELTLPLCKLLTRRQPSSASVVALTITDESAQRASTTHSATTWEHAVASPFNPFLPVFEQPQLEPGSFDIVVGFEPAALSGGSMESRLLELSALKNLRLLLAPGGHLVLLAPDPARGGTIKPNAPGSVFRDVLSAVLSCQAPSRSPDGVSPLPLAGQGVPSLLEDVEGYTKSTILDARIGTPSRNTPYQLHIAQKSDIPQSLAQVDSYAYSMGEELALRRKLESLETSRTSPLWITTTNVLDFGAAIGIARCLRAERPDIHLSVTQMPSEWTEHASKDALQRLAADATSGTEVQLDADGVAHVPALVANPTPLPGRLRTASIATSTVRSPAVKPVWMDRRLTLLRDDGHVPAHYSAASSHEDHVVFDDSIAKSRAVIGIASVARTMHAWTGGLTLPSQGPRVLLLDDGSPEALGAKWALRMACDENQTHVRAIPAHADEVALVWEISSEVDGATFDIILAGSMTRELSQIAEEVLLSRGATIYPWNERDAGLAFDLFARSPMVHATLADFVARHGWLPTGTLPVPSGVLGHLDAGHQLSGEGLFDASKAYVLIGGVGGLGVELAAWMVRQGAKHILLTSRSGHEYFRSTDDENVRARRTLGAMRSEQGTRIDVVASDATDETAMRSAISSITSEGITIGGVVVMPVVLNDALFESQTSESFQNMFKIKLRPLLNLEKICDLGKVDFVAFFSSVAALIGNPGQSNYVAANVAGEAFVRRHRSAFAIAVPGISDVGVLARHVGKSSRLADLLSLSMTAEAFFQSFGDAVKRSRKRNVDLYIPDIAWPATRSALAKSGSRLPLRCRAIMGRDAIAGTSDLHGNGDGKSRLDIAPLIADALGSDEEIDPSLPFAAYGLDSLAATRLSSAIKANTGVQVSQIQLLGGLSIEGLVEMLESLQAAKIAAAGAPDVDGVGHEARGVDVTTETRVEELQGAGSNSLNALVKLRDGEGSPIVLLHDGGGGVQLFHRLPLDLQAPLWAIQVTEEVPYDEDLLEVARCYISLLDADHELSFHQAPWRIAGFSASSAIALCMARLLEARGSPLGQLALIDNSPTLLACPHLVMSTTQASMKREEHVVRALETVARCSELDPGADGSGKKFASALWALAARRRQQWTSPATTPTSQAPSVAPASVNIDLKDDAFLNTFCQRLAQSSEMVYKAAARFATNRDASSALQEAVDDQPIDFAPLFKWLGQISTPVVLFVAERGLLRGQGPAFDPFEEEYADFGISKHLGLSPHIVYVEGTGHYDILSSSKLALQLSNGAIAPGA
ncbi:hypothetical protein IE81DRAFT_369188 [Ceraceosorus guamensis]|uniref:Uncharacterized protein n=1 Tax=Ceraceosorus guamensis TaxID=1522189 RepID=A0A316VPQ0_9BASI|nr:hypothetical protein IE81DRAFT_369188 [Ceraceosorus guamensis]PWN39310.1 hypothetical protein IE81DRAFT_369188 [Ceraceosorus guamensis]